MQRTHFVLIRHGESTWNREGRLQGQRRDVPLTELGQRQAQEAAERVRQMVAPLAVVFSSDQLRALQTAQPIAQALGSTVTPSVLLREQHLGDLEGKLTSELTALPTPPGLHISEVRWGGGESVADVYLRSVKFLRQLPPGLKSCVVVGHGDSLRILLAALNGTGHRDVDYSMRLGNADLLEVTAGPSVSG